MGTEAKILNDPVFPINGPASHEISFNCDGERLGRFFIDDGKIEFEGNFAKSAQIFFAQFVQPLVDSYIKKITMPNGE